MKTTLLLSITILLGATLSSVQAQDFRAVPPAEQPNAVELAYLDSRNPNSPVDKADDAVNTQLVKNFLTNLATGQFEEARNRLAEGFVAYGPGYSDKLEIDDLLNQWDRNGRLFANQHLTFETITPINSKDGNNRGQWVYVKGVWSAPDGHGRGKPIRIPFHHLARVGNNRIERTYTSYGNDQLFYDLGIALYASPSHVVQRR